MNDQSINPNETKMPPTAAMAVRGVQLHCDTPSGAAWLEKYEHPPRSTRPEYCGVPDYNNTPSVHPEYKTIAQIPTFKTVGADTTYYDRILVIFTSSAVSPVWYYRISTTGAFEPIEAIINSNINIQDWAAHNTSGRIAYKSTTISLNATEFSDQGVVTVAQLRPSKRLAAVGDVTLQLLERSGIQHALKFAQRHCGDLPVRQPKESDPEYLQRALGDAWHHVVMIVAPGTLPQTGTEVAMLSPNATSDVAKNGCFVVQKFVQSFPQFTDFSNANTGSTTTPRTVQAVKCYIEITDATGLLTIFEPVNVTSQPGNSAAPGTPQQLEDVAWFDMSWGFAFFEGLSVGPNGAGAAAVPPYLTIKTITGTELQPLIGSPLAPFIKNSAMVDETALRIGSMISHARLDSLPAAANFWGSLGKLLLSAAPTVVSTISNLFGKKPSAEEKKTTKSTVDKLTRKIESMETKLSAKPKVAPKKPVKQQQPKQKVTVKRRNKASNEARLAKTDLAAAASRS